MIFTTNKTPYGYVYRTVFCYISSGFIKIMSIPFFSAIWTVFAVPPGVNESLLQTAIRASELSIMYLFQDIVFKANSATLTPINTISLKGNITLTTKTTTNLGDSAQLSLEGDMLIFTCGNQKIALKF